MKTKMLFLHALSPLHAGTGRGVGVIDLPIAREKGTDLPILPGSSAKGVLRDEEQDDTTRFTVFGPATSNAHEYASSVQFTDLRLLLLPVRSLAGTFAWVTSPFILRRLLRDAKDMGITLNATAPELGNEKEACAVSAQSTALSVEDNQIVLEDLLLNSEGKSEVDVWAKWLGERIFPNEPAWQKMLAQRLCIVQDDVMRYLVQAGMDVTARIKLQDDTKTVQKGGLWYEEALPAETVLMGLVTATQVKASPDSVFQTLEKLTKNALQVGGNATVGRGLCVMHLV